MRAHVLEHLVLLVAVFPGLTPPVVWDLPYEEYLVFCSAAEAHRRAAQQGAKASSRSKRRGVN